MNEYIQYVHNLKGKFIYNRLRSRTREAIASFLIHPIEDHNTLEKTILEYTSPEVLEFIGKFIDLKRLYDRTILSVENSSYVDNVDFDHIENIINLRKINNTRHPNKLFRTVNSLLPKGGIYICKVETYYDRKMNFLARYGELSGHIIWFMDFIVNRVLPRLNYIKEVHNQLTQGRLHCISDCEMMGRLAYCGFEIASYKTFNFNSTERISYFIANKSKNPMHGSPSYYPIIKLNRIGCEGRVMSIYKLRTMHPYSEFIQEYVIRKNGYDETGKPARDFRITCWGKLLRRYHLDELPQLIHVFRGEMKLVGLRPLSLVRFKEIPPEFKLERVRYKPGLIPPYVSLNMPGNWERVEAEKIYLREYKKSPFLTDLKYFLKALHNILTNKL